MKLFDLIRNGDSNGVTKFVKSNREFRQLIGDNSPVMLALNCEQFEIVDILVDAGADVAAPMDSCPFSPPLNELITFFVTEERVLKFLENGANPNLFDDSGRNALICALEQYEAEQPSAKKIIRHLIKFGADMDLDQEDSVFGSARMLATAMIDELDDELIALFGLAKLNT